VSLHPSSASRHPLRRVAQGVAATGLAVAITAGAALLPARGGDDVASQAIGASGVGAATGTLSSQIEQLQQHLRSQPKDARSWAVLALVLVEQARATVDPTLYPKAEAAVQQSMQRQPTDNDTARAAAAAIAAAQHRFDDALTLADQALAINPFGEQALAIRTDALTELGRSAEARTAAHHLDALRPGLPATTRLAYQSELRGDLSTARALFNRALTESTDPSTTAFVQYHLGELARQAGHFSQAMTHYRLALRAVPGDPSSLAGQARVFALTGRTGRAIAVLSAVVARIPLPEHVIALGELLELSGHPDAAQQQYDIVRATAALAQANGVRTDLELAFFESDHGDPVAALTAARAEWEQRHAPVVADALAWALFANDRAADALPFARQAVRLGGDARAWHHLGAIESSLGHTAAARNHLRLALATDRGYSVWSAASVRSLLHGLKEQS